MPAERAVEADRIRLRVRHVGRDDGRHDDALSRADDPHLRARRASGGDRRQAVRRNGVVRHRASWPGQASRSRRRSARNGRSARPCSRR